MKNAFQITSEMLLKKITPLEGYNSILELLKNKMDPKETSRTFSNLRLSRCLLSFENKDLLGTWRDAAGHLRQIILMYHEGFLLHEDYLEKFLDLKEDFGFSIDYAGEINCKYSFPVWLKHANQISNVYDLVKRRKTERRLGDGLLLQTTGYAEYASKEQKSLVRVSMTMQPGETLLACLPTGGGKSLIGQLPSFFETKGGRIHGAVLSAGTTIVVVPTVALAIDQNRASREYFRDARGEEHRPQAYFGGISEEKKNIIFEGVRNGTIPLLYTSPEAIINGALFPIILNAAKENRIKRLVIDEAHIVVDWGSAFRTDFQLLSVFRKKILEASNGQLKTILLSATITDAATQTLKKLFSEDNKLIEFRSDALRYEPIFFLDRPTNQVERKNRILEVIPLLPKPLILYVSSKESARDWEKAIRESGYSSVICFTGETNSDERERILEKWNSNSLDMIVATSAFGMGVDKSDVRTVIHCCIPESINRFYQEVGRGGRDGYASISLLSATKEDELVQMNNSAVLTVDNMVERWERIRRSAKEFTGDSFWVDTNTRPHHLRNQETGGNNASWNETTILFLYRYGLLDILDIRKLEVDQRRQLLVKMIDVDTLSDRDLLNQKIEPLRKNERDRFTYEFYKMKIMVTEADHECFSNYFQETYPYSNDTCGGCPACHENHTEPFQYPTITEVTLNTRGSLLPIEGALKQYLGGYKDLFVYTNKVLSSEFIIEIINGVINSRVQTVIIPNLMGVPREKFIKNMPTETPISYSILEIEEIEQEPKMYSLSGLVAIIYPDNEILGDWVYRWSTNYQQQSDNNRVIHIAKKNFFIVSEQKQLQELIDGSLCNIEQLLVTSEEEEDWF
ncbi:protein DpdF [Neobacillus sp.]|uniref:protein DpdF n=1 Tax=Neobacillus sp. TaxID=2675273 RepID=UPI0028A17F12|nr:protein DpdF [Neobacillus sp.]